MTFFPIAIDTQGNITVRARAENDDGTIRGDAVFTLKPDDDGYEDALSRLVP
jgi:hypothetical protein